MLTAVVDLPQHTFAGNPLDRAEALRRDDQWLAAAREDQRARYLPFDKLAVCIVRDNSDGELAWVKPDDLSAELRKQAVLLGVDGEAPRFALDIGAHKDAPASLNAALCSETGGEFVDARMAAMSLPQAQTGILAQARSQLAWHQRHGYCSNCGAPTKAGRGGQVRVCDACDSSIFPRTDPVAIMLVHQGDRCLLGQPHGPLVRTGMYSALAGFIDHGESIEAAVRREVAEEAGINTGAVHYHSCQPWPFPYSLMIGCLAEATSTDIQIDPQEMADVDWFDRDTVSAALERCLAGEPPSPDKLSIPGPIAIAHHLIRSWLTGEPDSRSH